MYSEVKLSLEKLLTATLIKARRSINSARTSNLSSMFERDGAKVG